MRTIGKKLLRQLNDTNVYEIHNDDPMPHFCNIIKVMVNEALKLGSIDKSTASFLNKPNPRIPAFYLIPKIYKMAAFPPGRPILSVCGSALEAFSKFVDHFIQPLVPKSQTYICDTMDLIAQIEDLNIPEDLFFMTLDIASLYTNILLESAHIVIKNILDNRSLDWSPTYFILDCVNLVFENIFFRFEDTCYRQKIGVAMGSEKHLV